MTLFRSKGVEVAQVPHRRIAPALLIACLSLSLSLSLSASAGCDKPSEETRGAPPPPPLASAAPGGCAKGGGTVSDPLTAAFFPRAVDTYCVDPQGETRTFGEQGKLDLEAVCTMAFDGECAVYNQFGLKRLVTLRYIDGAGGGGTVDVNLSRFADANGAYGMFTKRVVADGDPLEASTPKPLSAGAAAAIGTGRAYVWKDVYLAELQYNNEQETPEALTRSSARILAALGKALGNGLPGPDGLPLAVRALPSEERIPSGLSLIPKDALGIPGLGPLAVGYYAGSARYRLVALNAPDNAKALEAWKLVKSRPGSLPVAGVGDEGVMVSLAAHGAPARQDYVFARKGAWLLGVGDEDRAPPDKAKELSTEDKVARLKAWLTKPLPASSGSKAP
jgi:hypothetical protein